MLLQTRTVAFQMLVTEYIMHTNYVLPFVRLTPYKMYCLGTITVNNAIQDEGKPQTTAMAQYTLTKCVEDRCN